MLWKTPPKTPHLSRNQVHLWQANLNASPGDIAQFKRSLSADELNRANRFKFEVDRQKFIVGRGVLRNILSGYLNITPPQIKFIYGHQQKPALKDNPLKLKFNLSHSAEIALYGFVLEREIGVDIEQIRLLEDAEIIARRFFSSAEVADFLALAISQKATGFFNCWTRKEAYLKARGDGIAATVPLNSFDVSLTPGQPAKLLKVAPFPNEVNRWQLRSISIEPNYIAAIVFENHSSNITFNYFNFDSPDQF